MKITRARYIQIALIILANWPRESTSQNLQGEYLNKIIRVCNGELVANIPSIYQRLKTVKVHLKQDDKNTDEPYNTVSDDGQVDIWFSTGFMYKTMLLFDFELYYYNQTGQKKANMLKIIAEQYYDDFNLYGIGILEFAAFDSLQYKALLNSAAGRRNKESRQITCEFIYLHELGHIFTKEVSDTVDSRKERLENEAADNWAFDTFNRIHIQNDTIEFTETQNGQNAIMHPLYMSWYDQQIRTANIATDYDLSLRIQHFINFCQNRYCPLPGKKRICDELITWQRRHDSVDHNIKLTAEDATNIIERLSAFNFEKLKKLMRHDTAYYTTKKFRKHLDAIADSIQKIVKFPDLFYSFFSVTPTLLHGNNKIKDGREKALILLCFFAINGNAAILQTACDNDTSCILDFREQYALLAATNYEYHDKDYKKAVFYYNIAKSVSTDLPSSFYTTKIGSLRQKMIAVRKN